MQAIKALVIGMGVLIVAGLALLGYGLANKWGGTAGGSPPESPAAAAPGGQFGTVALPVRPGGRMLQVQALADRLAVLIDEDGVQRIVLLDPASGTVTGTIVLAPQP